MDTRPLEQINYWKKCSVCKKELDFDRPYQVCDVSTCQGNRTGLTFCSIECWDSHLGFAHHRSASAEERRSPTREQYLAELNQVRANPTQSHASEAPITRRIVRPAEPATASQDIKTDTLVVVSKVKKLIKDQAGFNTSQCAIDALTKKVIHECLKGIVEARKAERKTVMGRDIE